MRASFLAPNRPRVMEEGESKQEALILMKNSHFDRTLRQFLSEKNIDATKNGTRCGEVQFLVCHAQGINSANSFLMHLMRFATNHFTCSSAIQKRTFSDDMKAIAKGFTTFDAFNGARNLQAIVYLLFPICFQPPYKGSEIIFIEQLRSTVLVQAIE